MEVLGVNYGLPAPLGPNAEQQAVLGPLAVPAVDVILTRIGLGQLATSFASCYGAGTTP